MDNKRTFLRYLVRARVLLGRRAEVELASAAAAFLPFLLGLAVTAGLLVPVLIRLRALVAEARSEKAAAGQQVAALRRSQAQLEEDLRFLTQFLKDYPRLARELYSGLGERQIPGVLLSIVQRSLDPQQAVVLVRRSDSRGDRGRSPRLVVAAAYPEGAAVKVGTEVPLDAGEIGFAAESQLVVSRQDLQSETAPARFKPGPALAGMPQPDVIAPLVFDQETLGVILVQKARKAGDPKAALRLVAQTGAQVLHAAAQVGHFRSTAEMDGLTRVFNQKHMEQALNEVVYRAACAAYDQRPASQAHPLSVFLFDVDGFADYAGTNGRLASERLLQELASLVREAVRKQDVFGRFGGEAFLLVLPHTGAAQALAAAEKIRGLVANHPFPFAAGQPLGHVSVSGGVASYPQHGSDAAGILRAAQEALQLAKQAGRDRVLQARAGVPLGAETARA